MSELDWENLCSSVHKITASQFFAEFAWKLQMRYFLTPIQHAKFDHSITPRCWRDCGESHTNYSHIFWSCPALKMYWENIDTEIVFVLKMDLKIDNEFILLWRIPSQIITTDDLYLIRILRLTALKLVTKNWLHKISPSIEKWRDLMDQVKEMEQLTYTIRGNTRLGHMLWAKWESYVENRRDTT